MTAHNTGYLTFISMCFWLGTGIPSLCQMISDKYGNIRSALACFLSYASHQIVTSNRRISMQSLFMETELTIHKFRLQLEPKSLTAQSIDRNDSWTKIAEIAREEHHDAIARFLENITIQLSDSPIRQ
ncbi:MAG: hypothetical protein KGI54_08485 [Pseudomonadota bacterium]|nr:hypothetical protein [Pseudomonadota bacterium]